MIIKIQLKNFRGIEDATLDFMNNENINITKKKFIIKLIPLILLKLFQ